MPGEQREAAGPVPPPYAPPRTARPLPPPPAPVAEAARGATHGMPPASWGWRQSLAGYLIGFGPMLALSLWALNSEAADRPLETITTVAAVGVILQSLVLYAWQTGAAWFFSLRRPEQPLAAWGFVRPTKAFFWTIPVALVTVYLIAYVHDIIVHPEQQEILTLFPRTAEGIALLTLLAVVMAPLFEELFFRGFLFRGLANSWGWVAGGLVSAVAFGSAHMQLSVMIPLCALGFLLAWVYKQTGSLWTSIALHAIFNAISVVAWVASG